MIDTATLPKKVPPDLQAFFDAIRYIDKNKAVPTHRNNIGRYTDRLNAFAEALQEGENAYQTERTQFFNEDSYASAMFASYGNPDEKQEKPKTLINLRELRSRPRPQWVIEGFIYENTIIELYAEAGCYKSFLAFDWSARIATGTDWLGRYQTTKKGPVIYIAAEGADGYISRSDAWCAHNCISFDTLAENFWFWPEPLPLSNSTEIAQFIEEVTDTLKDNEQPPQLVVIDTLLRCSNGENINAPDVMGGLFKGAESIKKALNVSNVLIVHHQGKNKQLGGMGSVIIKNNCDVIYSMEKDSSTEKQVILKAEKMKDKPELTTYLRAEKVYYGEIPLNEDEASLVIVLGEKPSKKEKQDNPPDSRVFMLDLLDEHKNISHTRWLELFENTEIKGRSKSNFAKLLRTLLNEKTIEKYVDGYRRYQEPIALQGKIADDTDDNEENEND